MLIAEELLLLALDNKSGKPMLGSDRLEPALGGALIVELALMERIGVTPHSEGWRKRGRVTVINLTPTDDPELDAALQRLSEREGTKVKDFLSQSSTKKVRVTHQLRERLLDRLARSGAVIRQEGTVLGFIPRTTWPAQDAAAEEDLRARLRGALVNGTTPTERTVALIALLHVSGLVTKVLPGADKKLIKTRAKALTEGDWAAKAVKDAIDEVAMATAAAAAGAAGASGGS